MKIYEVVKIDIRTNEEINYGPQCEEDMKAITRGYHFNGLFYEKSNSNIMYIVTEC